MQLTFRGWPRNNSETGMTQTIHTGACNCGAVRIRAHGKLREVVACHCSQCRKQTGLYYAATNIARDRLTIEGEGNMTWYQSSEKASRAFCRTCGSALFWSFEGEAEISVMAGLFDQPSDLAIAWHIFCADKGDFYDITDGLPQYEKGSPGLVVAQD
jgi:hypothetical protein